MELRIEWNKSDDIEVNGDDSGADVTIIFDYGLEELPKPDKIKLLKQIVEQLERDEA